MALNICIVSYGVDDYICFGQTCCLHFQGDYPTSQSRWLLYERVERYSLKHSLRLCLSFVHILHRCRSVVPEAVVRYCALWEIIYSLVLLDAVLTEKFETKVVNIRQICYLFYV
jgi:hypothetical protein